MVKVQDNCIDPEFMQPCPERGCENCFYEEFDLLAYPCAICIRGIERTDKWKPKDITD